MKGYGDPYPADGDLPFWEFYTLARDFGWRWSDYIGTPQPVVDYLTLYHSIEAPLRAQARQPQGQ